MTTKTTPRYSPERCRSYADSYERWSHTGVAGVCRQAAQDAETLDRVAAFVADLPTPIRDKWQQFLAEGHG